jgi:hypothetical protein
MDYSNGWAFTMYKKCMKFIAIAVENPERKT